ncbi:MAG: hypothetical protein II857_11125 [Selenomonadaceae bacterium]|nr:hypothetical protein [Selenomonadaceae bacterium]MBQ4404941.1 hypothetical protein [Selenomonadaceae bacterium]
MFAQSLVSASIRVSIENQTGLDIVSLKTTFYSNGAGKFELLKNGEVFRNNLVLPVVWGDNEKSKTMHLYATFQNGATKYFGGYSISQGAKVVLR